MTSRIVSPSKNEIICVRAAENCAHHHFSLPSRHLSPRPPTRAHACAGTPTCPFSRACIFSKTSLFCPMHFLLRHWRFLPWYMVAEAPIPLHPLSRCEARHHRRSHERDRRPGAFFFVFLWKKHGNSRRRKSHQTEGLFPDLTRT